MSIYEDGSEGNARRSFPVTRRTFFTGATFTLTLSACGGGGETSSAPVVLPSPTATQQPQAAATQSAPSESAMWPGTSWTGQAGSGFSQLPQDPVRTTAKPAMRLLVPSNQAYTDGLLVGVAAFANNNGSMLDNLGIKSIIVHYEGNKVEITQPTHQTFNDANGSPVTYLGWWVRLKHDGRDGDANLFFEAVPADSSLQSRIMGPFLFMPSKSQHDLELTVAPSQPEIAGSRYGSIRNALAFAARQGSNRAHITLTEKRDDYILESIGTRFTSAKGYATIDATVPVTIRANSFTSGGPRTGFDGLHFRGKNITIDHTNMDIIYHESLGNQHWFDGVTIMVTGGSAYANPATLGPKFYGVARNNPWFTECRISGMPKSVNAASLARGCYVSDGLGDAATDARCVVGNRIDGFDSSRNWGKDIPAFTVTYLGDAANATIELVAGTTSSTRTFRLRVNGEIVSTFDVTDDRSSVTTCSKVVNWINGVSGFRATLQNDDRRAATCSLPGLKGANFNATSVKGVNLQVVTMFDIHTDFWQHLFDGIEENVIVADNIVTNFVGQCFFISSPAEARDFVFVNNCFHGASPSGNYSKKEWMYCQVGRTGKKSHLVFSNNSMTQGWMIRTASGMEVDRYCLFSNNAVKNLAWDGEPTQNLRISDNHFFEMGANPTNATGSSFGGAEGEIWPGAASGNFSPGGALLGSSGRPSVRWDVKARKRADLDVGGAVAR